jgi:hypothetical protein
LFVPAEETVFTAREAVLMAASVVILVGGMRLAYRANGGAEGIDLAGRFLSIAWVIGLRLMLLWLAFFAMVFMVAGVAAAFGRELSDSAIGIVAWSFALMASLIFFWRLAHHLRDVSRAV